MSWLARSIANSLLSPDSPDADGEDPRASDPTSPGSPPRGVREDLSELTDALAHRFQGLASFLAAPTPAGAPRGLNPAEIAGRFRSGLARLPGRQAVADLAKNASSLLHPDEYWGGSEAAGATEDVVAFARDAAMRPELWLDSPLLPDDADSDDFDMSDAQQDHALAVDSMAPELADLRIQLCPSYMSEGCFWKIYFVLLHPKLTKEEAELLSTPQILEAREKLSQNSLHQTKLESNEDTVALTFSNAVGTVPVEVVSVVKDQDASGRPAALRNVDYGILEPIHLEALSKDTVSDAGAVASDKISSGVPVQLVPVSKDATDFSQSRMEESIHTSSKEHATESSQSSIEESTPDFTTDAAVANEHCVSFVDSAPSEEDQRKWPSSDLSEQSTVFIQKEAHNDGCDDDGDEWLEEDTGGPGSTHIPIVGYDEDISFSDLEEDD